MPSSLVTAAERHLRRLERDATASVRTLQRQYSRIQDTLLSRVGRLQDAMSKQRLARAELTQLREFGALFNSVETQLAPQGRRIARASRSVNGDAVRRGFESGVGLASQAAGSATILPALAAVAGSSIVQASSFVAEGAPLYVRLSTLYGTEWAEFISAQYITGIVNGWNPRRIANLIRQTVTIAIPSDLERIIRTAQLYAYREANRNTWISSGVVDYWVWWSALDRRTCGSCWSLHGQRFPVTESANDHYSGRVVAIPHTIALPGFPARDLGIESGESIFNGLSKARQDALSSAGGWGAQARAYRAGAINFSQLSREQLDRTYGVMRNQASLVSILGDGAEAYYAKG